MVRASSDRTVEIAERLPGVTLHRHSENLGYGANQKSCYRLALEAALAALLVAVALWVNPSRTPSRVVRSRG